MIAQPMKTTRSSILAVNLVCGGQPAQSLKFLPGDLSYLKRVIENCHLRVTAGPHERVLEFYWDTIS
jgi:hypothetical protein